MPALFQPYLFFNGQCADAMRFYERVFGGKIEMMMTYAEAPEGGAGVPPGSESRIMHASLAVQGQVLMASDDVMSPAYEGMKGVSVSMSFATADEARRVFDALADGGQVVMPLGKTFWAEVFGVLVDRYGTSWMVGVDHPASAEG